MAKPALDREEYPVSSLGTETLPQGIVLNGDLWTLQISYNRFVLQGFEGNIFDINYPTVSKYSLTNALDSSKNFDANLFCIWVVGLEGDLSFFEFQPFEDSSPIITFSRLSLYSNVVNVSANSVEGDGYRVIILLESGDLKSLHYEDIKLSDVYIEDDLEWSSSRLEDFNFFTYTDKSQLDISYLDVNSPPEVYIDSYSVGIPSNLSVSQIGIENDILLSWDVSSGADSYYIERDTNSSFTSPISYTVSALTYTDSISSAGTYYYRIRGLNTSLLLQSMWSSTKDITIDIVSDFEGDPLFGVEPLSVQFTDLTTPPELIISWNWDFGDGSVHSTEQNPSHSFVNNGVYTITLTVSSALGIQVVVKSAYITVSEASPNITGMVYLKKRSEDDMFMLEDKSFPYYGVFPDELYFGITGVLEEIVSYRWDFGEGGTSTDRNPFYSYSSFGYHRVEAFVKLISQEWRRIGDVENLIIMGKMDFEADPRRGDKPLPVEFSNQSMAPTGTHYTGWQWDLGDDTISFGVTGPQHDYEKYGKYDVDLNADFEPTNES